MAQLLVIRKQWTDILRNPIDNLCLKEMPPHHNTSKFEAQHRLYMYSDRLACAIKWLRCWVCGRINGWRVGLPYRSPCMWACHSYKNLIRTIGSVISSSDSMQAAAQVRRRVETCVFISMPNLTVVY